MTDPETSPPPGTPASGTPPTDRLPAWLQKLATESWQVELLISGFAIVGSAQLTGFLEPMAAFALFTFRADVIGFVFFAHLYFLLGFVLLPVLFGFHFAVRAFWVGIVGLASVYPDGIGPERSATAPEAYVAYVRERYPPLPVWIDRAEYVASLMFVSAALLAMTFVGTAFTILTVVGLAYVLEVVTGGALPFAATTKAMLAVAAAVFTLAMLLQAERLRGRTWAQRASLRLTLLTQYALYHVFVHPVAYLLTVLSTNFKSGSRMWLWLAGGMLAFAALTTAQLGPLTTALYNLEDRARDALRTDVYDPVRYEAHWSDEDHVALVPYVEREEASPGQLLEVNVPVLGQDRYRVGLLTPPATRAERDTARGPRQSLRRARELAAHERYFRFRIDSTVFAAEDFVRYELPNRERGIRALVRLPPKLPSGRHVLWVDHRTGPAAAAGAVAYAPAAAIPLVVE